MDVVDVTRPRNLVLCSGRMGKCAATSVKSAANLVSAANVVVDWSDIALASVTRVQEKVEAMRERVVCAADVVGVVFSCTELAVALKAAYELVHSARGVLKEVDKAKCEAYASALSAFSNDKTDHAAVYAVAEMAMIEDGSRTWKMFIVSAQRVSQALGICAKKAALLEVEVRVALGGSAEYSAETEAVSDIVSAASLAAASWTEVAHGCAWVEERISTNETETLTVATDAPVCDEKRPKKARVTAQAMSPEV